LNTCPGLTTNDCSILCYSKCEAIIIERLRSYETLLLIACNHIKGKSSNLSSMNTDVSCLQNNNHLIQRTIFQIKEALSQSSLRLLPRLENLSHRGPPRIFFLAREILQECNGSLDLEWVAKKVQTYQESEPLTMAELWILPIILRLEVVERLSHSVYCEMRSAGVLTLKWYFPFMANILRIWKLSGLPLSRRLHLYTKFANSRFFQWISKFDRGASLWTNNYAQCNVQNLNTTYSMKLEWFHDFPVSGTESKAGVGEKTVPECVRNIQILETVNWRELFKSVNRVEQILRKDPIGVYEHMDPATQDGYCGAVKELAKITCQSEIRVAEAALHLANCGYRDMIPSQSGNKGLPRIGHVGFYLLDDGRSVLEAYLNYCPPRKVRIRRWMSIYLTQIYLGVVILISLLLLGFITTCAYVLAIRDALILSVIASLFGIVPALEGAVAIVNQLVSLWVPPKTLSKLDFREGIPAEHSTLVAIPTLLADPDEVDTILGQIELHYLGNRSEHLYFALLTDFYDAHQKNMSDDPILLERLITGINELNKKYDLLGYQPFYLIHRERTWNQSENCWLGWERKRGKLVELNRLLRGQASSFQVLVGELGILLKVRYVITLDSDTKLPHEAACRLVATIAHPLNHAVFDQKKGTLISGYTVLQPRMAIQPSHANRSFFTRIFLGDTGLDLYARSSFDVYQDLFGEGNFMGKGIYDVDSFTQSLEGKVPDNTMLSHDLLEGLLGRAGIITDISLFEDYPPNYLCYARRLHRWVRGDWQLLPWLFRKVPHAIHMWTINDLSLLDRWKIFNNISHSLYAPSLFFLLLVFWLGSSGSALMWTLTVILMSAIPLLTGIITVLSQQSRKNMRGSPIFSLRCQFSRWVLFLVFLPYEALLVLDAVVRTLFRLTITRKHLLQWTPTAYTIRQIGHNIAPSSIWREMSGALVFVLGIALLIGLSNPSALVTAIPFLLVWLASPQLTFWLDRPLFRPPSRLPDQRLQQIRELARRTWLYFETFSRQDDNWIPPDYVNHKKELEDNINHRTSPTNIGFTLLSHLAAYDLGYIGPMELSSRLCSLFDKLQKLERHRGHFFNWYDTHTLKPIQGRYVSVVDSGNLAGCLLTLKHGCLEPINQPVFHFGRWQGVLDTLDVLVQILAENNIEISDMTPLVAQVRQQLLEAKHDDMHHISFTALLRDQVWSDIHQTLDNLIGKDKENISGRSYQAFQELRSRLDKYLEGLEHEIDTLLPWLVAFTRPPDLFMESEICPEISKIWMRLLETLHPNLLLIEIPSACDTGLELLGCLLIQFDCLGLSHKTHSARNWCETLAQKLQIARTAAVELSQQFQDLSNCCEVLFQDMDFRFLFDEGRMLFPVGYDVEVDKKDKSYYDLLASESRLASLVAIAKGDVPQSHWLYLARPLTRLEGGQALLSWNGSLFEYLLPGVLVRNFPGTLLYQTSHNAIASHILFGRKRGIPWGVSESCYYQFDSEMNFHYRSLGIQTLSLRSIVSDEKVIAPYASCLALSLRPWAVIENIGKMKKLGLLSPYGFYEAIDFTNDHIPKGEDYQIVHTHMCHHQGMIMLALTNYLKEEVMIRRFHADPRVESLELILQE
jgi:cyclic beta-1,2-glucan synthetase